MPATIECNGVPTGLTLTASTFPDGIDTASATGVSATEATNRKTTYSFSANTTGLHLIQLKSGSNVVWIGWAILATSGTIIAKDSREAAKLDSALELNSTAYRYTTAALENAPSGGGGGSGSGAYTLTITVNDGTTALQNATVRMTEGSNTFTTTTNASGVATFALDAATYSVAITKAGYQFTPTTKVVSATGSQTYSMTATSITPSAADQVTGYLVCYGETGAVQAGAQVTIRQIKAPGTGLACDGADRTETANGSGIAEFTGLFPGATYRLQRGTDSAKAITFTLPSNATDPTELNSIVGIP